MLQSWMTVPTCSHTEWQVFVHALPYSCLFQHNLAAMKDVEVHKVGGERAQDNRPPANVKASPEYGAKLHLGLLFNSAPILLLVAKDLQAFHRLLAIRVFLQEKHLWAFAFSWSVIITFSADVCVSLKLNWWQCTTGYSTYNELRRYQLDDSMGKWAIQQKIFVGQLTGSPKVLLVHGQRFFVYNSINWLKSSNYNSSVIPNIILWSEAFICLTYSPAFLLHNSLQKKTSMLWLPSISNCQIGKTKFWTETG